MLQVVQTIIKPLRIEPVIIIGESTERIQLRTVAVSNHLLVSVCQAVDSTCLDIELSCVTIAFDGNDIARFSHHHFRFVALGCYGGDRRTCGSLFHKYLFFCLCEVLVSPRHVVFQQELNLHEIFRIGFQLTELIRNSDLRTGTRSYFAYAQ